MNCQANPKHEPEDYVECDNCRVKGCRMCEEGWFTDFNEGVIHCAVCKIVLAKEII
jgi:hypothetical protein